MIKAFLSGGRARARICMLVILSVLCGGFCQAQTVTRFEFSDWGHSPAPWMDSNFCKNEHIRFGSLTVPENRKTGMGSLRLTVEVLGAKHPQPGAIPILVIHGGPGGRCVGGGIDRVQDFLRQDRDVILIDQRGCGFSEPHFETQLGEAFLRIMAEDLTPEQEIAERTDSALKVRNELQKDSVDVNSYDGHEIAADIEDLRKALGIASWDLFGGSYGTRIALTLMRDYPSGIHSVILDSPLPPNAPYFENNTTNFARSLNLLFSKFEADPVCRRLYPNLREDFVAAVDSLAKKPMAIRMGDMSKYPHGVFVVNEQDFLLGVQQALYGKDLYPIIPLWIEQVKARNEGVMKAFIEYMGNGLGRIHYELYYSVISSDCMPFNSLKTYEDSSKDMWGGITFYKAEFKICNIWNTGRPDPIESKPVVSNIPTLILSGEMDPIAPYGELTKSTLSNSYLYTFQNVGHNSISSDPDTAIPLLARFLRDPGKSPAAYSSVSGKPIHFVTDVHINNGIFPFAQKLNGIRGNIPFVLMTGLITLFFLIALIVSLFALIRRKKNEAGYLGFNYLYLLYLIISGLIILFFVGLVVGIIGLSHGNLLVLFFGLPSSTALVLLIPYFVVGLFLISVLVLVSNRRKPGGERSGYFSYLFWVASLLFVVYCSTTHLLY
jgi:pimeloyl-ACP methyl ester carboxylesterase